MPLSTPKHRWFRRSLKWIAILIGALIALALILIVAAFFWVRSATNSALPQLDGQLHVAGLTEPVTIQRDAHGVPHIQAANESDLFFAQGYITASERLWQMDAFRRKSNGELSEVLGPSMVEIDRMQRVLGIRLQAERIYASLAPEDRARLDAYAHGVNQFITDSHDHPAPEFVVLNYQPKPWRGADSISVVLMMAQDLDSHWQSKLARDHISARLNDPKLEADLYPTTSWRDHPPTGEKVIYQPLQPQPVADNDDEDDDPEDDTSHARLENKKTLPTEDIDRLTTLLHPLGCLGCAEGSNNWVVSGAHTKSGKPLLANDMHLALMVPGIWYMADLKAGDYHAAGVTLPGVPFVIEGHNEHVAWGFTALYADVQDLYLETLDGKGNYRAADGSWKKLDIDHEKIIVRGSKNIDLEVASTNHGPILSPILLTDKRPIALHWNIYVTASVAPASSIYQMNKASNWTEFSSALKSWAFPTQNCVYADDQGHIAHHAIGFVPLRPQGLVAKIVPAGDATHDWKGSIPFDGLPHQLDPPSGFIATANSRVTSKQSPYELTLEWVAPYRAERIYKLLDGRDQLTPKDMLAVQIDIFSGVNQEFAHRLAYAIAHTKNATEQEKQAADLLRKWDGRMSADSAAASIVAKTRSVLKPMILSARLDETSKEYTWGNADVAYEEIIMHSRTEWLPKNYKDWDALLRAALDKALESAPANVNDWSLGSWRVVDLEHPLTKMLPLPWTIAGTGALPLSGDGTTVKQVGSPAFGPSQRFIMDWSDIDGSSQNIPLGESGNPMSPYFKDQWNDYYNGTTFALPFTKSAVDSATTHTLKLVP